MPELLCEQARQLSYNFFWRDAANPRGLGGTTLDSYRTDSPGWDALIDVDESGPRRRPEAGVRRRVIEPDYRALIGLSLAAQMHPLCVN